MLLPLSSYSASDSLPIPFLQIDPPLHAYPVRPESWWNGVKVVADLLLGASFVALMLTPAVVGSILRNRMHKGHY